MAASRRSWERLRFCAPPESPPDPPTRAVAIPCAAATSAAVRPPSAVDPRSKAAGVSIHRTTPRTTPRRVERAARLRFAAASACVRSRARRPGHSSLPEPSGARGGGSGRTGPAPSVGTHGSRLAQDAPPPPSSRAPATRSLRTSTTRCRWSRWIEYWQTRNSPRSQASRKLAWNSNTNRRLRSEGTSRRTRNVTCEGQCGDRVGRLT